MSTVEPTHKRRRRGLFANDCTCTFPQPLSLLSPTNRLFLVRSLLFAFGDVDSPDAETVATFDDILQDYIIDLCYEASRVSRAACRTKIKVDDFKFAMRQDTKKLARVEELLTLQKVITEAKKIFDDKEGRALAKKNEKEKERERERERRREREKETERLAAAAAAAAAVSVQAQAQAATAAAAAATGGAPPAN